jgi:hypothetical protein
MGTTLSTFLLLVGTLTTTVISSIAANAAREKDWSKTRLWAGITMTLAILLVLLTLFIVIRAHMGAAELTGVIESMALGVMLSYIFLTLVMVIVAVLEIFSMLDATKDDGTKSMWYSIGSATTSIVGFIFALMLIIFAA